MSHPSHPVLPVSQRIRRSLVGNCMTRPTRGVALSLAVVFFLAVPTSAPATAASAVCCAPRVSTAAPASTIRFALMNSAPGIGSKRTTGSEADAASSVVSPPGFVTSTSAACINAGTSSVQPRTRSDEGGSTRNLRSLRWARLSRPAMAITAAPCCERWIVFRNHSQMSRMPISDLAFVRPDGS